MTDRWTYDDLGAEIDKLWPSDNPFTEEVRLEYRRLMAGTLEKGGWTEDEYLDKIEELFSESIERLFG